MVEKLIYLLDDNQEFLQQLEKSLNQNGFEVKAFVDPEKFLSFLIPDAPPAVLFVDHDLGWDFDGYEVVRRIRSGRIDGQFLPIIYLTGRESSENFMRAQQNDPYSIPSVFVAKKELISTDLPVLVTRLMKQFVEQIDLAGFNSVQRAINVLMRDSDS